MAARAVLFLSYHFGWDNAMNLSNFVYISRPSVIMQGAFVIVSGLSVWIGVLHVRLFARLPIGDGTTVSSDCTYIRTWP